MTIWDTLTGRAPSPSSGDSSSTSSSSLSPTADFNPPSAQNTSTLINPSVLDPAQLHPLAGLNQDTLDYLSLDESALSELPGSRSALPSRGWSDDLCYGTGVTYLSALTVGGAWGLVEGLNRTAPTASPRLKLNSCLNAITRRGPFLGNSAGVIALVYNGINSTIGYYRGKHDAVNSVGAGVLSGMIFKSTKGAKPMMISGALVGSAAGAWAVSVLATSFMLAIKLIELICVGYEKSTFLDIWFLVLSPFFNISSMLYSGLISSVYFLSLMNFGAGLVSLHFTLSTTFQSWVWQSCQKLF